MTPRRSLFAAWALVILAVTMMGLLALRSFRAGDCGSTGAVLNLWLKTRAWMPAGVLDGDYHRGMLTGQNLILSGNRYVLVDFFDMGPACLPSWGDAVQHDQEAWIEIESRRGRGIRRVERYRYIRWGSVGYLVEQSQIPEFMGDLNWFGRNVQGMFFSRQLEGAEIGGDIPEVPPEFSDYLKTEAVTAKVAKIVNGPHGDVMILDKGAADGLRREMILHRAERNSRMIATIEVFDVSIHESRARWHDFWFPEKVPAKTGWLWTTGQYDKPVD